MHAYSIGGLCFSSEIPLPAQPVECYAKPDVHIRIVTDRPELPNAVARGRQWAIAAPDCLIWELDRFVLKVSDGCRIDVWLADPVWLKRARTYLTGAALAALAMERRVTPYHGSAVLMNGKAVMILAPSGTGKSTLAAALCMQGCPALADDVCLPQRGDEGWTLPPVVTAPKIRTNVAGHFGSDVLSEEPDDEVRIRALVGPPSARIGTVLLVERASDGAESVCALDGGRAVQAIIGQIYRAENVGFWKALGWTLMDVASLADQVEVYRVHLPNTLDRLQHFVARVGRYGWAGLSGAMADGAMS